jgi:hypothetical protein
VFIFGIPDSDVILRTSGKYITVVVRKHYIVDLLVMTRIPELRSKCRTVHPIYIALGSPTEEMSVVPGAAYT